MDYEFITVSREAALTIVTINRPEAHNALNIVAHYELAHAFDTFRATKEAVFNGLAAPVETAMVDEWGYPAMAAMFASQDAVEGPAAFAEKCAPRWSGR